MRLTLMTLMIANALAAANLSDSSDKQVAAVERDLAKLDLGAPLIDPELDSYEAGREADKLGYMIDRNQTRLDKVPEEERGDARYVEASEQLQQVTAWVADWNANKDAIAAAKKKRSEQEKAFGVTRRAHDTASNKLRYWLESDGQAATSGSILQDMDLYLGLDQMAEACRTEHAEYLASEPDADDLQLCEDAMAWRERLAGAATGIMSASVERSVRFMKDDVQTLGESGLAHESTLQRIADPAGLETELQTSWERLFTELDQPAPEGLFTELRELTEQAAPELKKAASVSRYTAEGHKDGAVEGLAKSQLEGAGLTVRASSLVEGSWSELDGGSTRIRTGTYLAQAQGESFCRVYELTARQEWNGVGWGEASLSFDRQTREFAVSACN